MTINTDVNPSRRAFAIGAASAVAGLTIGFRWASAQGTPPSRAARAAHDQEQPPARRLGARRARRHRHGHDRPRRAGPGHADRHAPGRRRRARRRARAVGADLRATRRRRRTRASPPARWRSSSAARRSVSPAPTHAPRWSASRPRRGAVEPHAIKVEDGRMSGPAGQRMSYGEAAAKVSLSRPVDVTAKRKSPAEQKIIGTSYPRVDIPAKVFGQQVFIHDLRPEGMLFGAVARPPAYAARLVSADLTAIRAMPGVVEVVRDGSFLGVVARREEQAQAAANRLAKSAKWDAGAPLFGGKSVFDHLLTRQLRDGRAARRCKADGAARRSDPPRRVPPPFPGARLDRGELRARAVAGRQAHGVVAHAGAVPAARRSRQGVEGRAGDDPRHPRARRGLLRPQRRRRRGARCRAAGARGAGQAGARALGARGGDGLGALGLGHGDAAHGRRRGRWRAHAMDARRVVVPAFDAAGQRRGLQPALGLVSRRSRARRTRPWTCPLPTGGAARNAVPIYAAAEPDGDVALPGRRCRSAPRRCARWAATSMPSRPRCSSTSWPP